MRIILLRHGQFVREPKELLTRLGRKQAKLAGKRLKEYEVEMIIHSTMPRAEETALIVKEQIQFTKSMIASDLICECVPGFPKKLKLDKNSNDPKKMEKSIRLLNQAFKLFFDVKKYKGKTILIVCHGNVIRYLTCKVLGVDTLTWMKMDINQCGINVIEYSEWKKGLELISHNDIGHIPLKDRTFV